ncbi:hypothetical protein VTI74DRAFT_5478 [Chaetomium olivicolor]
MDAMNKKAVSSSPSAPRPTRRTRIVCIGDTHNSTPKLPKGDVLIHAGDLTNQGSYSELSKAVQWLEKADFEAKLVIAGNHDITLDADFYSKHGKNFHNQKLEDPTRCRGLFDSSRTITYLQHGSATIRLTRSDGPGTEFTVFGSPYCPEYGTWAFMYPRPDRRTEGSGSEASVTTSPSAAELWADIPSDIDILVTHTPPHTHCDDNYGCEVLRETLARVRPRLHVCGHVHQGRAAERVRWDTSGLSAANEAATESSVERWVDPNPDPTSAKMSLVDLTARSGKPPLDFHSSAPPSGTQAGCGGSNPSDLVQRASCNSSCSEPESQDMVGSGDPSGRNYEPGYASNVGSATESTVHLDRAGRRETCVVNCAIVATGWPHIGGKRFHKPIVVDIDLPVWG